MNRSTASLLALAFSTFALPAAAADGSVSQSVAPAGRSIGVGIELGAPTSINAKFMLASNQGVVVGVGGGIWYDASISLHADYLFHPLIADFNGGNFSGFVGLGAWTSLGFGYNNHWGYYQPYGPGPMPFSVGGRIPLGLSLAFNEVPVEVFVELVPSVALFPGIGVFGQGGLGARFYF